MHTWTLDTWFGAVGLTIGIVSLAVAIYLYRRSIQGPKPMYRIHPLRVRIVDKSRFQTSELEVRLRGVPVLDCNVTATTVVFWNDGRTPIRKTDILEAFTITIVQPADILDCSIVKTTREVCRFHLGQPLSNEQFSSVIFYFDIIEQFDGASIQLIHTGDPDATIRMSGVSVGAIGIQYKAVSNRKRSMFVDPLINALAGLTMTGVLIAWSAVRAMQPSLVGWVGLVVCVVTIGAVAVGLYRTHIRRPHRKLFDL